jgi:hypothetical protein
MNNIKMALGWFSLSLICANTTAIIFLAQTEILTLVGKSDIPMLLYMVF